MPRPLAFLVSSTKGLLALAPAAVVIVWSIVSHVSWWRGDWWWGYHNAAQAMPILIVLTAVVVAWDAGSPTGGYEAQLDRVPDRTWKVPLGLAVVPLASMVLLFAAATVAVAVLTLSARGVVDARILLVVLSHLLMLCVAAAVGLAAGRHLFSPYAAATAGGVMGLLLFWTPGQHHVFEFIGSASAIVNGTPSLSWFATQIVVLTLCAGLVSSITFRAMPPRSALVVGGLALGVFVAGSALGPTQQFEASTKRADRCASEGAVEVCVYPGYDRLTKSAGERLDAFLDRAASLGVDPAAFPSRYEQFGGVRPERGVGVLESPIDGLRSLVVGSDELAGSLSTPLWCDAMFVDNPPLTVLDQRQLVYDWVLWADEALPQGELVARHPQLKGTTGDEAAAIITESLRSMRACEST